jgi:hypothetical protein
MPKDLILLAADKDIDQGIRGLLNRPQALSIRPIDADIYVHPRRDPGCMREAHNFLRPFIREYAHAMVAFDHRGCGREQLSPEKVAEEVRERLNLNGWNHRAEVIVFDPELETWVFASSRQVESCLGWRNQERIRPWLEQRGYWESNLSKPKKPREALERVLRESNQPRSSSLYHGLGQRVSVESCTDRAFGRFRNILSAWFPTSESK